MTTETKDCYGVSWEERHPECAGGLDPLYTAPDGSHIRARCSLYEQCGQAFKANEAQKKLQSVAQQQIVPISQLARPQPAPTTVPVQVGANAAYHYQTAHQPPPPPPTMMARPYYPPPPSQPFPVGQMYPAVFSPAQTLLPHEAAPFLTVGEERPPGTSIWGRILAESLRAGLKGVLQQGAFIVDHTPFHYTPGKK